MRKSTIEKLCCPFDKSDLKVTIVSIDLTENIQEGYLHCSLCQRIYPIVMGIPIMNPDEYREFQFEQPLYERWSKYLKGKQVRNFCLTTEEERKNALTD